MNTVLKSLLTPLLCLCLVGGLLSGCTSSNSSQDTSTEYLSEQTQTESFPVRLEIGEENHIIQSKPRRLAVLSADLIQALEDIGAASLVCAVSNDAPANISVSGAKACRNGAGPGPFPDRCIQTGLGAGLLSDAPKSEGSALPAGN